MKKFLLIFLSLIISIGVAGCSVAGGGNTGETPGGNKPDKPPVTPIDPTPPDNTDDTPFTVSLWDVTEDAPFAIYDSDGTTALWTSLDDGSVTEVPFSRSGVATAEGLDGDYTVTVNNLPEDFVYNPNACTATNDERAVTVPVYEVARTTGRGTGWYDKALTFPKTGAVYKVTIESAAQKVCCIYAPPVSGEYFIESWADITANEINPRIDVHMANHGVVQDKVMYSINTTADAASSVFTKNFKYRIGAYSTTFVCAFELMCDSRVGYPVDVNICIARDTDYDFGEDAEYQLYMPKEEFKQTPEYSGKSFQPIANDDPNGVLRGERVGFNADDGYYHLLDENGAMTETILYAKIKGMVTSPTGMNCIDFYTGQSGASTDSDSGQGGSGTGSIVVPTRNIRLYISNGSWHRNYTFMIQGYDGLVRDNYPDANKYVNQKSYCDYVNSNGVYAVTQELKEFLQAFCVQNGYFYDGYGSAESWGFNSSDSNQWLFACGYYK